MVVDLDCLKTDKSIANILILGLLTGCYAGYLADCLQARGTGKADRRKSMKIIKRLSNQFL